MISIGPIDVSDALLIDDSAEKEEIIVEIEGEIGEQDGRIKIHRKKQFPNYSDFDFCF